MTIVKTYTTRAVFVTAVQFDGTYEQAKDIMEWIGRYMRPEPSITINPKTVSLDLPRTPQGSKVARKDDWIIMYNESLCFDVLNEREFRLKFELLMDTAGELVP